MNTAQPVEASKRYVILDALRGFALLGICMANFPEFSLFSFLSDEQTGKLPHPELDSLTRWFLSIFIDGKFYTIFSLLFGIGFSIIINNVATRGGNAFAVFYRRMFILLIIGFIHLMFIWSGDILMLYALMGMILPLFIKISDRVLLWTAGILLFLPVIIDFILELTGISLSAPIVDWQWRECAKVGITEDNFAVWLRDARSYSDVFDFLKQGAIVRIQEFVDAHRWFKVLGLFLIGFYIGRHRFYAVLDRHLPFLRKMAAWGLCLGIPLSCLYAWDSLSEHPFGTGMHSLIYFASVYLTAFGYIAALCLIHEKTSNGTGWRILSYPGRMALTNYIGQSLIGMLLYYGIGFGFGAGIGLFNVVLTAAGVFIFEILMSALWLSFFRFGPLEWIWRCLTYLRLFPICKH